MYALSMSALSMSALSMTASSLGTSTRLDNHRLLFEGFEDLAVLHLCELQKIAAVVACIHLCVQGRQTFLGILLQALRNIHRNRTRLPGSLLVASGDADGLLLACGLSAPC